MVKISALSNAGALTGAETIPLVQSGVTKKATLDVLLARAHNHTSSQITDFSTAVDARITVTTDTDKATPVNADLLGLRDSAASFVRKKLTWANVKATLKAYFDTVYTLIDFTLLSADASPDKAADYLISYDASAGGNKKVLMNTVFPDATTGVKGVQEIGTSPEVIAEADSERSVVPSTLGAWGEYYGVEMIAGTAYTAQSANTERSTTGTTYVKVKEFEIVKGGTFRISFELKTTPNGAALAYGRIYKNGVAFGAEHTSSSSTYAAQTDDLTFADGDNCELWYKSQVGTSTAYVQNFNAKYDFQPRFKANVNVTVTTD